MTNLIVDLSYFFLITLISFYFSGINWLYLAITAVHLITQFIKVACQVKFQSVEVAKYMYDQCVLSMHILRYPPTNSYFFTAKHANGFSLEPDTLTSTVVFFLLCVNQLSFLNISCSGSLFSSLIAQPLGLFVKALYSIMDLDCINQVQQALSVSLQVNSVNIGNWVFSTEPSPVDLGMKFVYVWSGLKR